MTTRMTIATLTLAVLTGCSSIRSEHRASTDRAAAPATDIQPHSLFMHNMVLQRGTNLAVWGTAGPGGKVTVSLAGQSAAGVADAAGNWRATLPPLKAGGPYAMTIAGADTITITNVLVGDVWICSGQSNMEQGIGACANPEQEIANADYPGIRLFMVPRRISPQPERDVEAAWKVCTPENVATGGWSGFSGVAYYFGRRLHKELDVPIGLIQTCWGGTVAEAWTSAEALMTLEDFAPAARYVAGGPEERAKLDDAFDRQMLAWWDRHDGGRDDPALDVSDWEEMRLPRNWEQSGVEALKAFDGLVWFRRAVELPADWAGKDLKLELGRIDDRDRTSFNGVVVGGQEAYNEPRAYTVPGKLVKAGTNVVSVGVLDTGGGGGLYSGPQQVSLAVGGDAKPVALAGEWSFQLAAPLAELEAPPKPAPSMRGPNAVTVLYNGMLAPLVPYGIKGAIWYQGESNASRPMQYRTLLPTLIRDWRSRFESGAFPFLIVQLANYRAVQTEPVEDGWAGLREAQLLTALRDPMVGLAVTTDIGEAKDIHPKNKQDVGKRLALSALAIAYGKDLVHSGPIYREMKVEGSKARLLFDHVGGGLVAGGGGPLKGFAVAGKDGKFVWADTVIDGDTIVVSSPDIARPVAVRYNWATNPIGNLYNKEGLPASCFRTDVD